MGRKDIITKEYMEDRSFCGRVQPYDLQRRKGH